MPARVCIWPYQKQVCPADHSAFKKSGQNPFINTYPGDHASLANSQRGEVCIGYRTALNLKEACEYDVQSVSCVVCFFFYSTAGRCKHLRSCLMGFVSMPTFCNGSKKLGKDLVLSAGMQGPCIACILTASSPALQVVHYAPLMAL